MKHFLLLTFLLFVSTQFANAQISGFEIEVRAEPLFNNAQIAELTTITTSEGSGSSRLMTVTVTNTTAEDADDLFMDIDVSSSREGILMESFQRNDIPFQLSAGEVAFISNLDIARGRMPNTVEPVVFDASLTSNGRDFLNKLQGITTLPPDDYTITVRIYRRNNSRNGGLFLDEAEATTGQNLIDGDFFIYQLSPGDFIGSNVSITNQYPEFRWEGLPQQTYRLVVVEAMRGESAEALIESVLSTPPSENGMAVDLLEHEYLDVLVDGTSYQYPSFGSKPLEPGSNYYWQVYSELLTTSGSLDRSSDIWSFRLREGSESVDSFPVDEELRNLLIALLGADQTENIISNNFSLFEIELDGEVYSGESAKDELMNLIEKIRNQNVKLID